MTGETEGPYILRGMSNTLTLCPSSKFTKKTCPNKPNFSYDGVNEANYYAVFQVSSYRESPLNRSTANGQFINTKEKFV